MPFGIGKRVDENACHGSPNGSLQSSGPSLGHEFVNVAVHRADDFGGVDHLLGRVEDFDDGAFQLTVKPLIANS